MSTPADLLRNATTADPARPLVTFYDDAIGERTELSVVTFANWVAKAANLLQEELDLTVGSTVRVELPSHWQAHVLLMAAWSLGACVVLDPSVNVDLRIVGPNAEAGHSVSTLAVAMRPMGLGFVDPPGSAVDFGGQVLGFDDVFVAWQPPPVDTVLLKDLPASALLDQATASWALAPTERLLTDEPASTERGTLLMPALLAADASLVLCRHLDSEKVEARRLAERVTRSETTRQ